MFSLRFNSSRYQPTSYPNTGFVSAHYVFSCLCCMHSLNTIMPGNLSIYVAHSLSFYSFLERIIFLATFFLQLTNREIKLPIVLSLTFIHWISTYPSSFRKKFQETKIGVHRPLKLLETIQLEPCFLCLSYFFLSKTQK